MIILHELAPVGNIIRTIVGPESDAMVRTHGNLMVDITPLLANAKDQPVFISLSYVDSEVRTLEILGKSGLTPPFYSPMAIIAPAIGINHTSESKKPEQAGEQPMNTVTIRSGRCHLCHTNNVEVISVKGEKPICTSCFKINMGLASKHYVKNDKGSNEPKAGI